MKKILLLLMVLYNPLTAQTVDELKNIEVQLTKRASPDKTILDSWTIKNTSTNRKLFNLCVYKNLLRINDTLANYASIEAYSKNLSEGKAVIKLKKRAFDDEIYSFGFYEQPDDLLPSFDEILDYNYLKEIIGEDNYTAIKDKKYISSDNNYKPNSNPIGKTYDINLNLLNAEIMFYSANNTSFLSLIGKWGDDLIVAPGWYYPEYILGIKYADYNSSSAAKPLWSISCGWSVNKSRINYSNLPERPLIASGNGGYISITGIPFSISKFLRNMEFTLSGKFNFSKKNWNHYDLSYGDDIFSNKNYFSFQINKYDAGDVAAFGAFKYGVGFAFYDIYHLKVDPILQTVTDLEKDKPKVDRYFGNIFCIIGAEGNTETFQHDLKILLNYEPSKKYGYLGFLFNFFINNTFGFDIRFFRTYTSVGNVPHWRTDEYFVFSPIIRISN